MHNNVTLYTKLKFYFNRINTQKLYKAFTSTRHSPRPPPPSKYIFFQLRYFEFSTRKSQITWIKINYNHLKIMLNIKKVVSTTLQRKFRWFYWWKRASSMRILCIYSRSNKQEIGFPPTFYKNYLFSIRKCEIFQKRNIFHLWLFYIQGGLKTIWNRT